MLISILVYCSNAESARTFNNFCFLHMHDVVVHDSNGEYHLKHLKIIVRKVREAGLKLELSECASFKWCLQNLGHLMSGEGICPLKRKVASLVNLAPLLMWQRLDML